MSFTELLEGIQHRHYALERGGTTNQSTEKLEATASETARAAHLLAITTGMTRLTKKNLKKSYNLDTGEVLLLKIPLFLRL